MALLGFVNALLGWLPLPFQLVVSGVVVIFTIVILLRIVSLILDALPFL